MVKNEYIGVSNIARKVKQLFVGENNVARKVKSVFVGVNNVARQFCAIYTWKKYNVNATTTQKTGIGGSVSSEYYKYGKQVDVVNYTSTYLTYTYGSETRDVGGRGESSFVMDYTMQMRVNSSACGVSSITRQGSEVIKTTISNYPISLNGHSTYSTWLQGSASEPNSTLIITLYYTYNDTSYSIGTYIGDVISSDPNSYPTNGIHSDGYWYVKQ